MYKALLISLMLLGGAVSAENTAPSGPLLVRYPEMLDKYRRDFDAYFIEVLTLALDKSKVAYVVEPIPTGLMLEGRSERRLRGDKNLVHWLNYSSARERGLVAIKVPLFKGLIGWRVLLIQEDDQTRFEDVDSIETLSAFVAAQGHDWPDTKVLTDNDLPVRTSSNWESLFRMLKAGRVDYFPRSLIEVRREMKIFKDFNLAIEKNILLKYPAAYYFFVSDKNPALSAAIAKGMEIAVNDGSFDSVFERFFGELIAELELDNKKVIELKSTDDFPLDKPAYWYKP